MSEYVTTSEAGFVGSPYALRARSKIPWRIDVSFGRRSPNKCKDFLR